jgi:hypothetical protein
LFPDASLDEARLLDHLIHAGVAPIDEVVLYTGDLVQMKSRAREVLRENGWMEMY